MPGSQRSKRNATSPMLTAHPSPGSGAARPRPQRSLHPLFSDCRATHRGKCRWQGHRLLHFQLLLARRAFAPDDAPPLSEYFQHIFIDNLNGDASRAKLLRTGCQTRVLSPHPRIVRASGRYGHRHTRSKSRCCATCRCAPPSRPLGNRKLKQLESESRHEAEPSYTPLTPTPALGNPFAYRIHSVEYTSWPRLTELLPIYFTGVTTSRDQSASLISTGTALNPE